MKRVFLMSAMVLIFLNLIIGQESFGLTAQSVLSELQSRYEKTNDLEASFLQESVGKVMKRIQKGEGKVYFKKKGMMRWDYRIPNQKLISNGLTLWYYQPEENQVFVSDIAKILNEKTPLAFLSGEGDLSRDFTLLNMNGPALQRGENFILELVPKEPYATLAKLVLTIDQKTYYVVQADVFDELGNVTRTRFMDIKTNMAPPDSFFQFSIPPGAEVLKMQGPSNLSSGEKGTPKK